MPPMMWSRWKLQKSRKHRQVTPFSLKENVANQAVKTQKLFLFFSDKWPPTLPRLIDVCHTISIGEINHFYLSRTWKKKPVSLLITCYFKGQFFYFSLRGRNQYKQIVYFVYGAPFKRNAIVAHHNLVWLIASMWVFKAWKVFFECFIVYKML